MKQSKVLSKKEKKEIERKMWLKFQASIKFPNRIEWSEDRKDWVNLGIVQ